MALTNKQQVFINEYLVDFNATQAAIRAGYSPKTARQTGSENLSKPDIKAAIEARIAELHMSANEVLKRLADHARGTMEDFIHPESLYIDLSMAKRRGKLHLLKKVKYTTRTKGEDEQVETVEFELYDAQSALVQLARIHGLMKNDQPVSEVKIVIERQGIEGTPAYTVQPPSKHYQQ